MKIFNLTRRLIPKSITMQLQPVEHIEIWPEREIAPEMQVLISRLKHHWGVQQQRIYYAKKHSNKPIKKEQITAIETWASNQVKK